MRLITWNCNMAFRNKWNSIIEFSPDIIVIQECENEIKYKQNQIIPRYNQFIWIGENQNKGIGIISFNDYQIEIHENYNPNFKYVIPLRVIGKFEFNLFAIWAMPDKKSNNNSYVGQIWKAVQYYESMLNSPSILIGDWNSNVIWNHQRKSGNHSHIIELLKKYKISSIYHDIRKEEQGEESEPTLYLLKNRAKTYHIDYCFTSKELATKETTITVGKYNDWVKLSDHMPIVVGNLIC